jgi:hypothetical protein
MNLLSRAACIAYACGLVMYNLSGAFGTIALDAAAFFPVLDKIDRAMERVEAHIDRVYGDGQHQIQQWLQDQAMSNRRMVILALGCLGSIALGRRLYHTVVGGHNDVQSLMRWVPSYQVARTWHSWWRYTPDYEYVNKHLIVPEDIIAKVHQILWAYQLPNIQSNRFPIVLIHGPPGTGKTTLAQAIAQASRVSFCQLHAGSLTHLDPQEATALLRQIVEQVKSSSPCMLIIDEAELIMSPRGQHGNIYSTIVYYLLQELEALRSCATIVLIVNDVQLLDPAIQDRVTLCMSLTCPDDAARKKLIDHFLLQARRNNVCIPNLVLDTLYNVFVPGTAGLSGRHIEHGIAHWLQMYHALGDAACRADVMMQCLSMFLTTV